MARTDKKPTVIKTASIRLNLSGEEAACLAAVQAVYAEACNRLVPLVIDKRCWNRFALHALGYDMLRSETRLGAQMCCNVMRSVAAAYKALRANGEIENDKPVPAISFKRASIHYDQRTCTLLADGLVSLWTLEGRMVVKLAPGTRQRQLMGWGKPKEAEVHCRKGQWYFNLVLEKEVEFRTNGIIVGVDVGENNLAAASTGKVWGGEKLRDERDRCLALRRRLQSNGSESAKQLLGKVSGREARHVRHVNHETSKEIVGEALRVGARAIALEDLTDIRSRIKAGKRMRSRLHRWAFRQLQDQIVYKAAEHGIAVVFVDPAYTSKSCSSCGQMGSRVRHRFACGCGRRAHSDVNAARNLAWLGESALSPRADVNRPNVGAVSHDCAP